MKARKKKALTCLSLFLFLTLLQGAAPGEEIAGPVATGEPIRITADKMEFKSNENLTIFEGNVVAVQGNITITADRLEVISGGEQERKAREIKAIGHVQFRQLFPAENRERFATGDRAHYWEEEGKIILSGNPKAWEQDNLITGQEMTLYTRENIFLVDGKVKAVFYTGSENPSRKVNGGGGQRKE